MRIVEVFNRTLWEFQVGEGSGSLKPGKRLSLFAWDGVALPNERVRGVLVACAFEVGDCESRRAPITADFKFLRVIYVIELGLTTSSCKEGGNSEFGLSDNFGPCMRPLPMSLSGSLCAFWIRGLLKIGRTM